MLCVVICLCMRRVALQVVARSDDAGKRVLALM